MEDLRRHVTSLGDKVLALFMLQISLVSVAPHLREIPKTLFGFVLLFRLVEAMGRKLCLSSHGRTTTTQKSCHSASYRQNVMCASFEFPLFSRFNYI